MWEVAEISLCWRSLNGEPVVWVVGRVWRKGHLPYGFLKLLWNFAVKASGRKRFYLDSSQTVLLPSGYRCLGQGWTPRASSQPLFGPSWGCFVLEAGEGTARFSITSKQQGRRRRRAVSGRGPDACGFPASPLPLICQATECWSQSLLLFIKN